jgi:hypothetical protein
MNYSSLLYTKRLCKICNTLLTFSMVHMSEFSTSILLFTTQHNFTLPCIALRYLLCTALDYLHYSTPPSTFALLNITLYIYTPECSSPQRRDVEGAGYSSTSECIRSASGPESTLIVLKCCHDSFPSCPPLLFTLLAWSSSP